MQKIKTILYATDLSESAKPALSWAMSLAEKYDASISIIHIIPDMIEELSASMGYDLLAHYKVEQLADLNKDGQNDAKDAIKDRIKSVCDQMNDDFPSCRMDFHHIIIKAGHPVKSIIDTAKDGGFDIVVMGTHGHGILDNLLLGSVARGVVQKCPIPVLTIRI